MTRTVLILGAGGRFGRAAVQAFAADGWHVRAATRTGKGPQMAHVSPIACDATEKAAVIKAASGADVIVHAVNPLYHEWPELMPVHTANVIAAGLASGATVMIPGNVYTFGANADEVLREDAAPAPTSRKGALRLAMEQAFQSAQTQGLRTIILRGGDFIERETSDTWFDRVIAKNVQSGSFAYPGVMDAVHAWAYLPDMARAMVALAHRRADLAPFATFGFEGFSLTGQEFMQAISQAIGRPLKVKAVPWRLMRALGMFMPTLRELHEMRYLWNTPHRLDGAPLRAVLPDFTPTPLADAMADVMSGRTTVA